MKKILNIDAGRFIFVIIFLFSLIYFLKINDINAEENIPGCELNYPLNKSLLVNNNPLLVVKKSLPGESPEFLHLQLAADNSFNDLIINKKISNAWQYQIGHDLLEYGKRYFWRARLKFPEKEWSAWSNILQFKINKKDKYKRQRGFTDSEIITLQSSGKLKQILKGYFPEDMSVSRDGEWLTFYEHSRDISNNKIYLMPTDGSHLRIIPAPYGYKSFPRIMGDFLYVNYRPPTGMKKGKGIKKGGVYRFNLKKPGKGWVFIAKNYTKYLRTNQPWIFKVFKQSKQINIHEYSRFNSFTGKYPVFVNLKGKYRKIIMDSKRENLFAFIILNRKLSKYDTDFAIYHSQNRKNSAANLLLPGAIDPSIGTANGVKHILLYTKSKPQTGHVYAYDLESGRTYFAVKSEGALYCNQPVFNPVNNKFYFHAQLNTDAYGIFEAGFQKNYNLNEQTKKQAVLEKIDYYLNNNYNWKKAFLHLATNQHLLDKDTYFKIRAKIDRVEAQTKRMKQQREIDYSRPVDAVAPAMILVQALTYDERSKESNNDSEKKLAKINNFYIGKYEVTNKEVAKMYNWAIKNNILKLKGKALIYASEKILDLSVRYAHLHLKFAENRFSVSDKFKNQPVIQITWKEAALFCNLMSLKEGYHPYYNFKNWRFNDSEEGYRLPTETEWEFAARGGIKSKNYIYSGGNDPGKAAWCIDNFYGKQPSVGLRSPNELGLYDMSGNVWEWCNDYKSDLFESKAREKKMGKIKAIRGGSWMSNQESITWSSRSLLKISGFSHDLGFRVARSAE